MEIKVQELKKAYVGPQEGIGGEVIPFPGKLPETEDDMPKSLDNLSCMGLSCTGKGAERILYAKWNAVRHLRGYEK